MSALGSGRITRAYQGGLSRRFSYSLTAIVTLIMILFSAVVAFYTVARVNEDLEQEATEIIRLAETSLASAVWQIDYSSVNDFLEAIFVDETFYWKTKEKGLNFLTRIDPGVPEAVILDEVRLRQILFNLIGNAVKFTHEGAIELTLIKRDKDSTGRLLDLIFSVRDTGIGIARGETGSIFDAFRQQEGQSTKRYAGTGLGLTITKRLVDIMGGRISVNSTPGEGSVFEVTLSDVAVADAAETGDLTDPADIKALSFLDARLLVVDDMEENRSMIKEYLQPHDVNILEAETGEEALEMIKEAPPDLVLMDIKLPGMDGYEATRIIKEDPDLKPTPVIGFTALAMKDEEERAALAGCDGYLKKPLQKRDLLEELKRHLPYRMDGREGPPPPSDEMESPQANPSPGRTHTPERLSGVIEALDGRFELQWERVRKRMVINEIRDFALEIRDLGVEAGITALNQWGEQLAEAAGRFDIDGIQRALAGFPDLRNEVLRLIRDEPLPEA